jgi:hypothetical protein
MKAREKILIAQSGQGTFAYASKNQSYELQNSNLVGGGGLQLGDKKISLRSVEVGGWTKSNGIYYEQGTNGPFTSQLSLGVNNQGAIIGGGNVFNPWGPPMWIRHTGNEKLNYELGEVIIYDNNLIGSNQVYWNVANAFIGANDYNSYSTFGNVEYFYYSNLVFEVMP